MRGWGLFLLCAAPAVLACELPGGPVHQLPTAGRTVLFRAVPAPSVGTHFALEIAACPPPEAIEVDASMPDHRHGMNYRPSVRHLGGERYIAEGLLFHMPGRWELQFTLRSGGQARRFSYFLQLK